MRIIKKHLMMPMMCTLSACGSGCGGCPDALPPIADVPARHVYQAGGPAQAMQQFGQGISQEVADKVELIGQGLASLSQKIDVEIVSLREKAELALKRTGDMEVDFHQFKEKVTGKTDDHEKRIGAIEDKLKNEWVVPPAQPGEKIL